MSPFKEDAKELTTTCPESSEKRAWSLRGFVLFTIQKGVRKRCYTRTLQTRQLSQRVVSGTWGELDVETREKRLSGC